MERCRYDYRYDEHGQALIVEWNDNNLVYMGTNCHKITPVNMVQRRSKRETRIIEVQQPNVIAEYNRCMEVLIVWIKISTPIKLVFG
ncbi:hypothetical protein DPMN_117447 [Dreissena polymorpha]|uniref:Uncharacterized protein n=1 Tax=Dreissena polymorpha TaxID=45954 RepID=A0A9D4KRA7_DREPO|nr:hypothetical protein DPMN_117447 [Dreissena polymorpha]